MEGESSFLTGQMDWLNAPQGMGILEENPLTAQLPAK
jgi:hypothetical protein